MNKNKCEPRDGWVPPRNVPRDYGMCQPTECPEVKSAKRLGIIVVSVASVAFYGYLQCPQWGKDLIDAYDIWPCVVIGVILVLITARAALIQSQWNREPWYHPHKVAGSGDQIFPPFPR